MKGLVPLLEAVAKLRTERDVELVVIGRPRRGRPGRPDHRPARARRHRALRERHLRRRAGRPLRRGPGGGGAVALRGLLAAGDRGHGLRRPAGGHHRRGAARGGGRRRRDRPARPARRPRGAGRGDRAGCSTTPRWPARLGRGRRRAGARPLHLGGHRRGTAEQYEAVLAGHPLPGARPARGHGRAPVRRADRRLRPPRGGRRRPAARPRLRRRPPRLRGGALGARVVALDAGRRRGRRRCATRSGGHGRRGRARAATTQAGGVQGDALRLPFADGTFDRVIASEVLEHIPDDAPAMAELARVLRPGGTMAVTVPRCGPEVVNWALSTSTTTSPAATSASTGAPSPGRAPRRGRAAARSGRTTPTRCTRRTGGCAAWSGPADDDHPGRARLPPAARLGHRASALAHPGRRAGAQPVSARASSSTWRSPHGATTRAARRVPARAERSTPHDRSLRLALPIPEVAGVLSARRRAGHARPRSPPSSAPTG